MVMGKRITASVATSPAKAAEQIETRLMQIELSRHTRTNVLPRPRAWQYWSSRGMPDVRSHVGHQ